MVRNGPVMQKISMTVYKNKGKRLELNGEREPMHTIPISSYNMSRD